MTSDEQSGASADGTKYSGVPGVEDGDGDWDGVGDGALTIGDGLETGVTGEG